MRTVLLLAFVSYYTNQSRTAKYNLHKFSFLLRKMDDFLKDLPKFIRLSDDMNRMANYINDLRIITIVITVTSYIGVFAFLLSKYRQHKKKRSKDSANEDTEMQDGNTMIDRQNGYFYRKDKDKAVIDS